MRTVLENLKNPPLKKSCCDKYSLKILTCLEQKSEVSKQKHTHNDTFPLRLKIFLHLLQKNGCCEKNKEKEDVEEFGAKILAVAYAAVYKLQKWQTTILEKKEKT